MEDNGATFDELGNEIRAANDSFSQTPLTSPDDESVKEANQNHLFNKVLSEFKEPEDKSKFAMVFGSSVEDNDKTVYLTHLDRYFQNESNDLKSNSLKTRLHNFESSDEFKSCPVKEKLSSRLVSLESEQQSIAREERREELRNLHRTQESSAGLDANERQMGANLPKNAAKTLQNVSNLAGSGTMAVSNAITNLADGLVGKPVKAISNMVSAGVGLVTKRNVVQHQEQLKSSTSQALSYLKQRVDDFHELPAGSDDALIKTHLDGIRNGAKSVEKMIRDQARSGMYNALDDNIPDSIKKNLSTIEEVIEDGKDSVKSYKGVMDRLMKAPALEGNDKQKETAAEMAKSATELMKKLADMIKGLFGRKGEANEVGIELTESTPSPQRMSP